MAKPEDKHPSGKLLERFMRNEADAVERRQVVRHLIAGCASCIEVTGAFWSFGEPDGSPAVAPPPEQSPLSAAEYQGIFARLASDGPLRERRIWADQEQAPALLEDLLSLPPGERLSQLYSDERLRSPALGDLLANRSRDLATDGGTALEALVAAELSVALADRLDAELCGASVVASQRTRAWSCLGNARRAAGDRLGAERALQTAVAFLPLHPIDPLVEAELHVHRAALEPTEEAVRLLDRAATLYRATGESRQLGKTLVRKALVLARSEDDETREAALDLLREGAALLDESSDARALAAALEEQAALLAGLGRRQPALLTSAQSRRLYAGLGDRPAQLRLRRLEGAIESTIGTAGEAEPALLSLRDDLVGFGLGREAAVASLDLGLLYSRQGRGSELERLARGTTPILTTRDVGKDTLVALMVFRRAAERKGATPALLSALTGYLAAPPPPGAMLTTVANPAS